MILWQTALARLPFFLDFFFLMKRKYLTNINSVLLYGCQLAAANYLLCLYGAAENKEDHT